MNLPLMLAVPGQLPASTMYFGKISYGEETVQNHRKRWDSNVSIS